MLSFEMAAVLVNRVMGVRTPEQFSRDARETPVNSTLAPPVDPAQGALEGHQG